MRTMELESDLSAHEAADGFWWRHWPTAVTTDEEIDEMVAEECDSQIARELLYALRDGRRGTKNGLSDTIDHLYVANGGYGKRR